MLLKLASLNMQFGVGLDGVYDLDRTADAVAGSDIICFQEIMQHWQRFDYVDQAAYLADRLNMFYVFGATMDLDASYRDGDGKAVNRRRTYGNMVASRWPIRTSRTIPLPHRSAPEVTDYQRCAVEAVIETPAGPIRAYSVHLTYISSERQAEQARRLVEEFAAAPDHGAPFDGTLSEDWDSQTTIAPHPKTGFIAGDMNSMASSAAYAEFCGVKNARGVRVREVDQLVDAWVAAGEDELGPISFPANDQHAHRVDHMFMTPDLAAGVRSVRIGDDCIASDHYPIFAEVEF